MIELSRTQEPELFELAKVSLGALGIVAKVTLQCVPAHRLLEHTFVLSAAEVEQQHTSLLQGNKHVRYMWVPYTDTVVVVTNNPIEEGGNPPTLPPAAPMGERLQPFRQLLKESFPETDEATLAAMSFADYRDQLIAAAPLDTAHVVAVNRAEAEFWKLSEGYSIGWSDTKLQFECGGQQWVSEVGFPVGSYTAPNGRDLEYMRRLMELIESTGVPAPSPIEQRWSSGSSSALSIASSEDLSALFSWVGIIMYLPSDEPAVRAKITDAFFAYRHACEDALWQEFGAVEHWAKVEASHDDARREQLRKRLSARFPVNAFNEARLVLHPSVCPSSLCACFVSPAHW